MALESAPSQTAQPRSRATFAFRIAFFLVAGLILAIVAALPLAIRSLAQDLFTSVESPVYAFNGLSATAARGQINISIVDLDESKLKATVRVSGHRTCPAVCPPGHRVVLFSLWTSDGDAAGMPPSAKLDLTGAQSIATENVELPVHGHPTLYPFDTYDLWLGVGLAAILPDGTIRPITRAEAAGLLRVTVQEKLPRESMIAPVAMAPIDVQDPTDPYELLGIEVLHFARPLHERVLAVLLVMLVAAAAAYAVFMRPLHDLVINSGGLVLGVWGIRALLSPGTATRTLVDLSLSIVILFLLSAITFRALQFLYQKGQFRRPPAEEPAPIEPPVRAECSGSDGRNGPEAAYGEYSFRRRTRGPLKSCM